MGLEQTKESTNKIDKTLSERESQILDCIVESYVQSAKPVGSRYLAKRYNLGISPATIRNVMTDLEDKGFLSQPHVSAGRVPTDMGYRYYVNRLRAVQLLSRNDRRIILDNLRKDGVDVYDIFEAASQILGKISSQLGVVLEPRFEQGIFDKMELVPVAEQKVLAVISIKSGLAKTIMMAVDVKLSRDQLVETSRLINERLSGLPLHQIRATINERLNSVMHDSNDGLILMIVRSSKRLFTFDDSHDLHLGGTHNIISNPEFADQEYTAKILELIESKEGLVSQFSEVDGQKIRISIGEENSSNLFWNCSIISSNYRVGDVSGTLGVVGPTRMYYPKIISLVEYMGRVLTQQLCSEWS